MLVEKYNELRSRLIKAYLKFLQDTILQEYLTNMYQYELRHGEQDLRDKSRN